MLLSPELQLLNEVNIYITTLTTANLPEVWWGQYATMGKELHMGA